MSNTVYTREVGRKFYADGTARPFPGNTIICFIAPEHPIGQGAVALQGAVSQAIFGNAFTLLPPSSLHMTVMELLCDQVRTPERWSAQLPLDAPLDRTDEFFLERVPAIPAPEGLTMRVVGLSHRDNLMLTLQPADDGTAATLRSYRAAIAAATGVRFPDHDSYGFHISLAYRLRQLDVAQEAALAETCAAWLPHLQAVGASIGLPKPTLTFFDDMTRFVSAAERQTLHTRQKR